MAVFGRARAQEVQPVVSGLLFRLRRPPPASRVHFPAAPACSARTPVTSPCVACFRS